MSVVDAILLTAIWVVCHWGIFTLAQSRAVREADKLRFHTEASLPVARVQQLGKVGYRPRRVTPSSSPLKPPPDIGPRGSGTFAELRIKQCRPPTIHVSNTRKNTP